MPLGSLGILGYSDALRAASQASAHATRPKIGFDKVTAREVLKDDAIRRVDE